MTERESMLFKNRRVCSLDDKLSNLHRLTFFTPKRLARMFKILDDDNPTERIEKIFLNIVPFINAINATPESDKDITADVRAWARSKTKIKCEQTFVKTDSAFINKIARELMMD